MTDAATRTYQRSYELQREMGLFAGEVSEAELANSAHRYSSAFAFLDARKGDRVLELGYGGPAMLPLLARHASEYHIVDIVDRTLDRDCPVNVKIHCSNLDNDFPFADASFDVVIAMMVIEHLYDPFHAFAEVSRLLGGGGMAFVNLPNVASLKCRLQLLAGRMPMTSTADWFAVRQWDGGHLHYFTVADVRRLAAWAGLELVALQPVGRFAAIKRLRPQLFCHEITYTFRKPVG